MSLLLLFGGSGGEVTPAPHVPEPTKAVRIGVAANKSNRIGDPANQADRLGNRANEVVEW